MKKFRESRKLQAIEYKGGKCEICNYNKCSKALEFHHKDHQEKDFSISQSKKYYTWEKIKKELDKCILVCANCHREIHDKINKEIQAEVRS